MKSTSMGRTGPTKLQEREASYPDDAIFFTKRQIRPGVILHHFGRMAPNSSWRVVRIVTWKRLNGGDYLVPTPSQTIRHLSDTIYLCRIGVKDERAVSFASLSYSAIWRLPA